MKKIILILCIVCCCLNGSAQARKHKFELYDAMGYVGKPTDLSSMGLLRIKLIYEANLTKPDPEVKRGIQLDMDKIRTHVESASYSGLHVINTDIEHWYGFSDPKIDTIEIVKRFEELFAQFRDAVPGVQIANYGVPLSALCVMRFYDGGKTEEQALIDRWLRDSRKRIFLAPLCDYLSPSVYIAEPDIEQWIRDLKITVHEIRKFEPDKKLLVYIWPSYYDKPGSPYFKQFVTPEIWRQMLEAVYEHCDGAVIWSSSLDADGSKIQWSDPRVQEIMDVTKRFLDSHGDNVAKQPSLPPLEPLEYERGKKFDMFHALAYPNMPDLSQYGIRNMKIGGEGGLTTGKDANGIGIPDSTKIAKYVAKRQKEAPNVPILINQITWLNDRQTDNAAMTERFAMVNRIFKRHNNTSPLMFFNVGPASLDQLRHTNNDFYANVESWLRFSAIPTRDLRQYADIVLPTGYIIDDDVTEWERRFRVMVREARYGNLDKPVYAYLSTQYFNTAQEIIDGDTWFRILEVVYALCDGVVIADNSRSAKQSYNWDDLNDLWKATETFLDKYNVADKSTAKPKRNQ